MTGTSFSDAAKTGRSGRLEKLVPVPNSCCVLDYEPGSWSSDGAFLRMQSTRTETGVDLWVLPTGDEAEPYPYVKTTFREMGAAFSRDKLIPNFLEH